MPCCIAKGVCVRMPDVARDYAQPRSDMRGGVAQAGCEERYRYTALLPLSSGVELSCGHDPRLLHPGRQLLKELREAFANLRREHTTRCLVLKSAVPGTFCAGADLKASSPTRETSP